MKIIRELVKIFGIDDEVTDIERDTYIFTYKKEHEAQLAKYEAQEYKRKFIIDDYHAGYEALLDTIIDNKNDMPKIKAAVQKICEKYYMLFYMQSVDVIKLYVNDSYKRITQTLQYDKLKVILGDNLKEFAGVTVRLKSC